MALTEDQKKLLIGGGVGALALVVGFVIFGGKAVAAPVTTFQQPERISPPQQRVPVRDLERKRKKRRHDDDNERGDRGDRGENGRGEYGRKKHGRHRRDD